MPIRELIRRFDARTILDYGSGKGAHYARRNIKLPEGQYVDTLASFWEVDQITCYDPAYVPFSDLPTSRFDGVICTDVFEHCPEEHSPWIVDEAFSFSRKFVYANVACYPAKQSLPNGGKRALHNPAPDVVGNRRGRHRTPVSWGALRV